MKKLGFICAIIALTIVGCKEVKKETETTVEETAGDIIEEVQAKKSLSVELESKNEREASGEIYFIEENGLVTLEGKLNGLSQGMHAIHIHEKSDCSSSDGKSAGGHWNPTMEQHGKWGDDTGYHKGDIGNFEVDKEGGTGYVKFSTDEWCIGCVDENKNILGKAIIVHQGTDDFTSQPSGNAGARVVCGGIIK